MRNTVALGLLVMLTLGPFGAGLQGPEPDATMATTPLAVGLEPPRLCEGDLTCPDLPFVVDEHGDTMTGRLTMQADVALPGDHGVRFPGGILTGNGSLAFNGQPVCLGGASTPGCGDITAVLAGFGLAGGGVIGDVALAVDPATVQRRIAATCPPGSSVRAVFEDGSVACEVDDDTTYSAGTGLLLAGTVFHVDAAAVQTRVSGVCAPGNSIRVIAQDGTVACEVDDDTTYAAGTGLLLNGTVFSADTQVLQRRVTGACLAGSAVRLVRADGSVACEVDDDTTYAAGAGLSLQGTTFHVDTLAIQNRVAGTCAAGSSIRSIAQDGTVGCEVDDDTTYSAGAGLALVGTSFRVDFGQVQARILGACAAGSSVRAIASDGDLTCEVDDDTTYTAEGPLALAGNVLTLDHAGCSAGDLWKWNGTAWACGPDVDSGGDVTSVIAGFGLLGGGSAGDLSLGVDDTAVQRRVTGTCAAGSAIRAIAQDGAVNCEADRDTTYAAGFGLQLNGTTFAADPAVLQRRVAACADGSSIRAIAEDGGVTCETDDGLTYTAAPPLELLGGNLSLSTTGCSSGESWEWTGSAWSCDPDDNSGGDITGVTAGEGLIGGGTTGDVSLRLATPTPTTLGGVRAATCGYGMVLTAITTAGTPVCTTEDSWAWPTTPRANTYASIDPTGLVGLYTSMTIGADGLPVVAYLDYGLGNLKVAQCTTPLCSAATVTTVDASSGEKGAGTSIAIGTDGLPVIAYFDSTDADLLFAHCGNPACSAGNTFRTLDSGVRLFFATQSVGQYPSIAVAPDGRPIVSYHNLTAGSLMVLKCGTADCASGNVRVAADLAANDVGEHTSIAIGADGLPIVAYHDATAGDLRILHCGNAGCTSGNVITVADATNDVGEWASIAVGADGLPVVAYYDRTLGDVKVLRCGNFACNAGNTIAVADASANDVGEGLSLAIGRTGLPMVAYQDKTLDDLKFLACGNEGCSAGNVITDIDPGSTLVGAYPSLALGVDGLPVAVSYDGNNADLRAVHLTNDLGVSNWWRRG